MADSRLSEEFDALSEHASTRIARFIEPFRVRPGSKVNLAKDFDPAFEAGIKKKEDGVALLQEGSSSLRPARRGSRLRTRTASWLCFKRSMPRERTGRSAT
jgi:hypothetical protein